MRETARIKKDDESKFCSGEISKILLLRRICAKFYAHGLSLAVSCFSEPLLASSRCFAMLQRVACCYRGSACVSSHTQSNTRVTTTTTSEP
jgi:hypothetical protein